MYQFLLHFFAIVGLIFTLLVSGIAVLWYLAKWLMVVRLKRMGLDANGNPLPPSSP